MISVVSKTLVMKTIIREMHCSRINNCMHFWRWVPKKHYPSCLNNFRHSCMFISQLYNFVSSKALCSLSRPPKDAYFLYREVLDFLRDIDDTFSFSNNDLQLKRVVRELLEISMQPHFKVGWFSFLSFNFNLNSNFREYHSRTQLDFFVQILLFILFYFCINFHLTHQLTMVC